MIYFDNASTTWPKPEFAQDICAVNADRGQYKAAARAGQIIENTRAEIKNLLGCNASYETILTSSATEALNAILQGLDYENIRTVYITPFEHNAVLRTINCLQSSAKFAIMKLAVAAHPLGPFF
jgi:cysteine sulfinate desulfinase/cysteine desulfurase-like protein